MDSSAHSERPARSPLPAFGRWLQQALAVHPERLTWKEVARRAGLSYSFLIQIKNGHERPSSEAIETLERVLGQRWAGEIPAKTPLVTPAPPCCLAPVYRRWPGTGKRRPRPDRWLALVADSPSGPHQFFVVASDSGLSPAIPRGAFCLTDGHDRHPRPHPELFAVLTAGGLPVIRLLRSYKDRLELAPPESHPGLLAQPGLELPVGEALEAAILGRIQEVRISLHPAPREWFATLW